VDVWPRDALESLSVAWKVMIGVQTEIILNG
jgi:hypothetical protein